MEIRSIRIYGNIKKKKELPFSIVSPFSESYLFKQGFSALTETKSKKKRKRKPL